MDNRSRFHALMNFEPVDRLPKVEWATWWDKTIERWHGEGLPPEITDKGAIHDYFGLDVYRQMWLPPRRSSFPHPPGHGEGVVSNWDEYEAIKPHLYPEPDEVIDIETAEAYAKRQATGEMVVWITIEGFFWYPRTLFGIEPHLYAFYEQPDLMHAMNEDLLQYNLRVLDRFCEICRPDFMTFAEDMSYNNGPMISEAMFDEFMAPYYRRIVPRLLEYGTVPIVDSDGDVIENLPWFLRVGVRGLLPLERQAGFDIVAARERYPDALFIGAFDKMTMTRGENALRAEFERLLPVMRQGGFVPGVDHQTPPGVSLEEYRVYLRLLDEYAVKGAPGNSLPE